MRTLRALGLLLLFATGAACQSVITDLGQTPTVTTAPSAASAVALVSVGSSATEGSHVLKASAGNLYTVTVNTGGTAGYLMVFNATAAPVDGAVTPAYCVPMQANAATGVSWQVPVSYATGITVVFSSTGCLTKTVSATVTFYAQVK